MMSRQLSPVTTDKVLFVFQVVSLGSAVTALWQAVHLTGMAQMAKVAVCGMALMIFAAISIYRNHHH